MKVSVAICTYNGEKYIEKQLKSILNQTRMVDEIVICDDGSKDATLSIADDVLKNSSVKYQIIQNEQSLQVVKNFKKCYSLCSGDVIFSSDQDDMWMENKVERIMSFFENDDSVNLVATNANLVDENDVLMNLNLRESVVFDVKQVERKMFSQLLNRCCITGATMAVRKSFADEHFHVSQHLLHDGWLALIAAYTDSLVYLDENLISYRLHGNNVCGVGDVDILKKGTFKQLIKTKQKRYKKTMLKSPFYFQDFACEKYDTYREVATHLQEKNIESNHQSELMECVEFWKEKELHKLSYKELKQWNKKAKQFNQYQKFTESEFTSTGDFYCWCVYQLFKSKNR